ncbi:hypothetical protein F0562_013811 [Nyssa sinensis]|uniref:non-specific serine/threonine protein kinase n=1 Tax=Nyssa sinensis TaxID=561372 RepID=A0A5J4ZLT2_9ASTE|nr:hypothetical protein F0562_013811 [Nyssa sinensis]
MLLLYTLFYLCIIIPLATPLNFSFPSITTEQNSDITTYQDAYITGQGLQLTPNELNTDRQQTAGRATYKEPLHLWDKASGKLTDFDTNFSFIIDSGRAPVYGDGFAFALLPNHSDILITKGGAFGLPINSTTIENTSAFVAVEFDTFRNGWDPADIQGTHVEVIQDTLNYTIDLRYLPEWVNVCFSASTGSDFERHTVTSWNFSSTLQIDQGPMIDPGPNKALVVGLSVGLCVLVVGLALVGIGLWKKRSRAKEEDGFIFDLSMDDEFEKGSGPKKFSFGELARATNNFAEEEKLGEGGFGGVYRGFIREFNSYVAVKRVSRGSKQGLKEYASEVKIISRLRHRNLVQLIGWCHEKGELLLVYEFMPNGSLDFHLFNGKSLLTWPMRYKIVQGLALSLLYLHEEWEQCVVHRDIKASNIMLDSNFNAKLGDFGLARLVDHEKGLQTTVLAGTMGYMAPEYVITGKASKESDVYSFGVVALEIACGRKPIDPRAQETQTRMVDWVWDLYGMGKLLEAADKKLCGDFDEQEMECLMRVGLSCVHPDFNLRPSIRQAINVLNFGSPLPILPSKMPVPTYLAPPGNFPISFSSGAAASESSQIQSSSYSYNTDSSKDTSSAAASPSAALLRTI